MDTLLLCKALLLGIVEGLTEFLPVSSTGHLIVVGSLIDFTDAQSKVFEIVIQLGAILAVCWHYRTRLAQVAAGLGSAPEARRFIGLLLVAFLPAAALGLVFHHAIKTYLFNPLSVAAALVLGGFAILYIEKRARAPRIDRIEAMSWGDAFKVGCAQALALLPGTSRSGATIMGGMVFGLSRQAATEFSFFLAIPTMFAATFYDVAKNWQWLHLADLPVFGVGFIAAFFSAMLTVNALLRFVARHTFVAFAWYRIAFGAFILLTAASGLVRWQAA
jgi:undecaprenyl-diphosphatase